MSEITVVFGIFCLMIFYEPLGTILTFLFLSISGYLFYIAVQRNAAKWGASRKFHEGNRIQWLQQGFAAIKDIKILNRLEYFLNSFSRQNKITNESLFKEQYASSLPRLWLEFFAIIGFVILFLILLILKKFLRSYSNCWVFYCSSISYYAVNNKSNEFNTSNKIWPSSC